MRIEQQLSVFLENRPGTLASMCEQLAAEDINIVALSVGDTADYAVVRLVVDRPDRAVHVLGEAGTLVVENDVAVVKVDNRIGALGEMAEKLRQADINIDYAYCTAAPEQSTATLVFRTPDPQKVVAALQK